MNPSGRKGRDGPKGSHGGSEAPYGVPIGCSRRHRNTDLPRGGAVMANG